MSDIPDWPRSPSSREPFSRQIDRKGLPAPRRHRHRGPLPLLRRRLRPAHLHQGRQAHRHRGRTRESPINEGTLCPKGANAFQLAVNPASRHPGALPGSLLRPLGDPKPLDWALDQIAHRVKAARDADFTARERVRPAAQLGALHRHSRRSDDRQRGELPHQEAVRRRAGCGLDREPGPDMTLAPRCPVWAPRSAAARPPITSRTSPTAIASCSWARTWRRPTRSAFRWPMKAKEKGATLIHVDPRFTRTSALCDVLRRHPRRQRHRLPRRARQLRPDPRPLVQGVRPQLHQRVEPSSQEGFRDTEDLRWPVQRLSGEPDRPAPTTRGRATGATTAMRRRSIGDELDRRRSGVPDVRRSSDCHGHSLDSGAASHSGTRRDMTTMADGQPATDPTLQHPRCVFQILKRHFARYTPEMVSQVCGCTPEELARVAELLCANSGRERTSAIVYALGWTQHTTGVQMIRTAGILQLLLGNMGRPGGGIMAMRGHSTIQGSTDLATLYDALPGYLPQPAADEQHETLDAYVAPRRVCPPATGPTSASSSSACSRPGTATPPRRTTTFASRWLPRVDGDYSQLAYFDRMARGEVKGYFLFGQNPGGGGPNAGLHRAGLRNLDWLVVLDWFEIESAVFWKNDPGGSAARRDQDRGVLHSRGGRARRRKAASPTPSACSSGTTRRSTRRATAAPMPGSSTISASDSRQLYAGSTDPRDQALLHLTWDYDFDEPPATARRHAQPDRGRARPRKVLRRSTATGWTRPTRAPARPRLVTGFLRAEGRRHDRVRVLDLQRRLPRAGPQPGPRAEDHRQPASARVGLRLAAQPPHALQPRLGRPRGPAMVRA